MFSFALWDEASQRMFCARDRFGIKPFYYTVVDGVFYFASEAKALLPFLPEIDTDPGALAEYLTFQRSEEHTSELQSLMRISYAVFCLKKKKNNKKHHKTKHNTHYHTGTRT